ncbi:hypothetical protein BCR39DRAFT_541392 [Naematelia encephala]|uniref:Uncharacterized protein n=1 Tax=Naematelia encephala TaxID=71784 RepID=A0A1Y2AV68_9TREE|nr:hypothetical protein BCR39DRAFT_541392 [Naematelia encephala]
MGILDWFPCCGPRRKDDESSTLLPPSSSLTAPNRPESIISSSDTGLANGYGSVDRGGVGGGMTEERRRRIEEISRDVGSQMLPIHLPLPRNQPPSPTQPSQTHPSASHPATSTSSTTSSRPSSPSPLRPETSPPGGVLRTPEASEYGEAAKDEDGVVRKTLFLNPPGGSGGRRVSGRGRGRGRGRGKGK